MAGEVVRGESDFFANVTTEDIKAAEFKLKLLAKKWNLPNAEKSMEAKLPEAKEEKT